MQNLPLTEDQAQELSLLLARCAREGRLEAPLTELRDELTRVRVAAGWVSPTRVKS